MRGMRLLAVFAILGLSSAALAAEQIDNPEYAQWARFKPGSSSSFKQTTQLRGGGSAALAASMLPEITMTTKLVEIKPDMLTLELTISTTRQSGEKSASKSTRAVPARFDKPVVPAIPATQAAPIATVGFTDAAKTVVVGDKKFDCTIAQHNVRTTVRQVSAAMSAPVGLLLTDQSDVAPTTNPSPSTRDRGARLVTVQITVWNSPEIPGGMVKSETPFNSDILVGGNYGTILMTLLNYKVAD